MTTLKTELNIFVPKELATNLDFWYTITESIKSNSGYIPSSFLKYLSEKYGYAYEVLNNLEYRQFVLNIAMNIYNGTHKSLPVEPQQSYFSPNSNPRIYKKVTSKERKRLLHETPIAEFL